MHRLGHSSRKFIRGTLCSSTVLICRSGRVCCPTASYRCKIFSVLSATILCFYVIALNKRELQLKSPPMTAGSWPNCKVGVKFLRDRRKGVIACYRDRGDLLLQLKTAPWGARKSLQRNQRIQHVQRCTRGQETGQRAVTVGTGDITHLTSQHLLYI